MIVKDGDKKVKLTKGFIDAIKNLMIEEIKMMHRQDKTNADCWEIGVCNINDLSIANGIEYMFGSKSDLLWMKKYGKIVVKYNKNLHGI